MKYCYHCKLNLPEENFSKNKSKPDGLGDECKSCKKITDKKYREKHINHIKKQKHNYYLQNTEEIIERTSQYSKDNRNKCNAWYKISKENLKNKVFSHYCENAIIKCRHCGKDNIDILTLDHINNNGNEHRKQLFNKHIGGYNFYQWVKKNNFPPDYQVLCHNCNFIKFVNNAQPKKPTNQQLNRIAYSRKLKAECLSHYGGIVCPCGEDNLLALTLHHINNNGAEHRKSLGNYKGNAFYFLLKKNNFPNDPPLQTLCKNCNIVKRQERYNEIIIDNIKRYNDPYGFNSLKFSEPPNKLGDSDGTQD